MKTAITPIPNANTRSPQDLVELNIANKINEIKNGAKNVKLIVVSFEIGRASVAQIIAPKIFAIARDQIIV